MRWLLIGGVILDVLGLIWFFQGINVLPGSFMTGDPFWARTGAFVFVIGFGSTLIGALHGRRSPGL